MSAASIRAPARTCDFSSSAACWASVSGDTEWAIIKKPTVSNPSSRANPKCWIEMSASVQCVATRTIETPMSRHARMSSIVPMPGTIRAAIFACRAVSTATRIRSRSSVRRTAGGASSIPRPPSLALSQVKIG